MRILCSWWGFVTPLAENIFVDTPDGERGNRVDFVDEMQRRGHTVVQLQQMRDMKPYPDIEYDSQGFPDGDIVYAEWRWPTWKNSGPRKFEPDYDRQCEILDYYHDKGVPIVIHDGDLQMTKEDEERWPHAIISDACYHPKNMTRRRIRLPWTNYMHRIFYRPSDYAYNYTYVGNKYDRDTEFEKYYCSPSEDLRMSGIQTVIHGNWLQYSPEREDPAIQISKYPFVSFGQRLAYKDIFKTLNESVAVTHISRQEYYERGNITGRFYEAIKSQVVSLIPSSYKHALPMGLKGEFVVSRPWDVVKAVQRLSELDSDAKMEIVQRQEEALRTFVTPDPGYRVDVLENIQEDFGRWIESTKGSSYL